MCLFSIRAKLLDVSGRTSRLNFFITSHYILNQSFPWLKVEEKKQARKKSRGKVVVYLNFFSTSLSKSI